MADNAFNFGIGQTIVAVFDTGTSFTMIPEYYWSAYID